MLIYVKLVLIYILFGNLILIGLKFFKNYFVNFWLYACNVRIVNEKYFFCDKV